VAKWEYVGTGDVDGKQITHQDILNGTNNDVVYCEPLVLAFKSLVKEALDGATLTVQDIQHDPCILRPGYTCIDPRVIGNVRGKHQTYAERNQCFFSAKHVYCQIESGFYDPCFLTTYSKRGECILSDYFIQPDARTWPLIQHLRVTHKPFMILKKVTTETPRGFKAGWIELEPNDLGSNELVQFNDFAQKKLSIYGIGQRLCA
jgi:hypothetical protein